MILDDIRDKVLEGLQTVKAQLDESDSYNQLKERFDSFSPLVQKLILSSVAIIFSYALLLIPFSYYDTGTENVALYEENRDLVLDLYRVKRRSVATPQTSAPLETSELESRARNAVSTARVQPEQIKGVSMFDNSGAQSSSFIPKNVTQNGVEIRLANLNLSQVVEIGHALTNMGSAKIIGMDIRAGSVPGNYFDATFKVVSFNIASAPAAAASARRK